MANHKKIRRYILILEKIEGKQHPSRDNLLEYLREHDLEVSVRTLIREIGELRNEFGFDIIHDKQKGGYYIKNDDKDRPESFIRFLEIAGTADLLTESLKENKETLNYISFDSLGLLKGIGYLKDLLYAIKNHRIVTIEHQKYVSDKVQKYVIKPYLLKEYLSRWYLVGIETKKNEFRTYGIDRIQSLFVESKTYKYNKKIVPTEFFQSTIGLTYNKLAERVILKFTPKQGQYVKTLPLHHSQEIIEENKMGLVIRLWLRPNYELNQRILAEGENVKVIEPKWLADEIKLSLAKAVKQYK